MIRSANAGATDAQDNTRRIEAVCTVLGDRGLQRFGAHTECVIRRNFDQVLLADTSNPDRLVDRAVHLV